MIVEVQAGWTVTGIRSLGYKLYLKAFSCIDCILIMEILQAKVRLLQNFPQKVVLDTKKTKLSLIQSNNLLRLLNCNSR